MVVDYTITIGNVLEMSVIAVGGMAAIMSLKNNVNYMKREISDVKDEIKKMGEVLTELAVANQRITNLEQDMRDIKRGRGFIKNEINGE